MQVSPCCAVTLQQPSNIACRECTTSGGSRCLDTGLSSDLQAWMSMNAGLGLSDRQDPCWRPREGNRVTRMHKETLSFRIRAKSHAFRSPQSRTHLPLILALLAPVLPASLSIRPP